MHLARLLRAIGGCDSRSDRTLIGTVAGESLTAHIKVGRQATKGVSALFVERQRTKKSPQTRAFNSVLLCGHAAMTRAQLLFLEPVPDENRSPRRPVNRDI
jgi:hypothetical protein